MGKIGLGCVAILVILVLVVGISLAGTYNRLVTLGQETDKQWSQVENQYQRRADLVPNLVATVQGAAQFEKSTLEAVVQAHASLGAALQRLLVVVERYPELKANANFRDLQAQLEGTENRIAVARMDYNKAAQDYNTARLRFPTNLMANLFGFKEKAYFKATSGAERAPAVQFNFGTPATAATPAK